MGVRVAILCRPDLFPTQHGAAARIVRSAEALVAAGDQVVVLTDDRNQYWRVRPTGWEAVPYGPRLRAFLEWPLLRNQARAERWCARVGYPREEYFLYRPIFDPAWWSRALYVGLREQIDVFQAEFPGFAAPAVLAGRLLGAKSFLSQHNIEYDRLRQMAGLDASILTRIRRIEILLMQAVDQVLTCSEEDRQRAEEAGVSEVVVLPHGVDLANYQGQQRDLRKDYGLPPGPVLFFHGTLHYAPNTEAVAFLAQELVPRLPAGASLLISGMGAPTQHGSERLIFTGPVEDLPAHIQAADLCLCPLFAGGGTRMKLLEYFAGARAVVSTPLGAEGLPVKNDRELVIAEKADFVEETLRLLRDPSRRERLGRAARRFAAARDWSAVGASLQKLHRGGKEDFVPRPSIEGHLPPRQPSKPLTLLLLVNRGCNLRCVFCDLWDKPENMPLPKVLELLTEARQIGTRTLVLTGGEPLLHPQLPQIIAAARSQGMDVNLTSNGTLLDRHYDRLVQAGLQSISFSLDGLPETHDRLRGQKGAWARTWKALVHAVHDKKLDCCVYFVVTRENVRELVPLWEQVRSLGVRFDFWPVNDAPDLYLRSADDKAAWTAAVAHIARHDRDVARRAHYYAEGLNYHAGEKGPVRCLGLVDQYGVTYDGSLLPCCVWGGDGLKVGNVFDTPLSQLWSSPEVQQHREKLYGEGCTAGCYNHSLYEFAVSTGESHRIGGTTSAAAPQIG